MNRTTVAILSLGLGLAGCEAVPPDHVQVSGSYPDVRTGNASESGTLTIDHPTFPGPQIGGTGRMVPMTPPLYTVYDQNGDVVENARGKTISLAPGRYLIQLDNEDPERAPFWVTIESGKTTVVDAQTIEPAQGRTLNAR
ncbi:MAG TPA: hypothetical protein VKW04_08655 [Planctomycetota bacterium]|nr:hypothetical protein [Planctomycetota bacterium]